MAEDKKPQIIPFNLGKVFKTSVTVTFILEILSVIMVIGSLVAYIINTTGIISTIDFDTAILLLLIGGGVTLFVFLLAIGAFVRFHAKIQHFVMGKGIGIVDINGKNVRTVFALYGGGIFFMFAAAIYSYYMIYKNFVIAIVANSLSLTFLFIGFGILYVSVLIQFIIAIVGRTASRIVEEILLDEEKSA